MAEDIRSTPVSDIMTTRIEMVDEATPISFAAKLLVEKQISGLPVTDDDGAVSGVISAADLMRAVQQQGADAATAAQGFYAELRPTVLLNPPRFDSVPPSADALLVTDELEGEVRDYMSTLLVAVDPGATVGETARLMSERRVRRVLVLDRNRNLAGLVTQSDIVRLVGGEARPAADVASDGAAD